VRKDK